MENERDVFQDFVLKERKHYGGHAAMTGGLDSNLIPKEEEGLACGHLARVHDAHRATAPDAGDAAAAVPPPRKTGGSQYMTSYQAACAGVDENGPKRRGKRAVQPSMTQASPFATSQQPQRGLGGASTALWSNPPDINAGTVYGSGHIPGYGGHVAATPGNRQVAPAAKPAKDMLLENYRTTMVGCTKHVPRPF